MRQRDQRGCGHLVGTWQTATDRSISPLPSRSETRPGLGMQLVGWFAAARAWGRWDGIRRSHDRSMSRTTRCTDDSRAIFFLAPSRARCKCNMSIFFFNMSIANVWFGLEASYWFVVQPVIIREGALLQFYAKKKRRAHCSSGSVVQSTPPSIYYSYSRIVQQRVQVTSEWELTRAEGDKGFVNHTVGAKEIGAPRPNHQPAPNPVHRSPNSRSNA